MEKRELSNLNIKIKLTLEHINNGGLKNVWMFEDYTRNADGLLNH